MIHENVMRKKSKFLSASYFKIPNHLLLFRDNL